MKEFGQVCNSELPSSGPLPCGHRPHLIIATRTGLGLYPSIESTVIVTQVKYVAYTTALLFTLHCNYNSRPPLLYSIVVWASFWAFLHATPHWGRYVEVQWVVLYIVIMIVVTITIWVIVTIIVIIIVGIRKSLNRLLIWIVYMYIHSCNYSTKYKSLVFVLSDYE